MEDDMKEIKFREETPKLEIKPKPKEIVLPNAEPILSNVDVTNFEKFQEVFNTSTDMEFLKKAINTNNHELNETIESLLKQVRDTWGCKMCG